MTHDELLLNVGEVHNWYEDQERFAEVVPYLLALRAVVELHKPFSTKGFEDDPICRACSGLDARDYPCLTIQAIEKELS